MGITICPRCSQRIAYSDDNSDIVHACNSGNAAVDQESIQKIGTHQDFTSTSIQEPNSNLAGQATIVGGLTYPLIKEGTRNVHGKRVATHYLRQHYELVEAGKNV